MLDEVSLLVGGKAGEGVRSTGYTIGRILNRHGLNVFIRDDYQSLIEGGHNFSQIRASSKETWSHYERVDLIAALDQRTVDLHEKELVSNGYVLYDPEEIKYSGSRKALSIPSLKMVKEIKGLKIMRNMLEIIVPVAWAVFLMYTVWYFTSAIHYAPLSLQEVKMLS